ncbi:capsule biosynthesis protein [Actibacterium ureilyticum]|uniref:capsule biosynthesis protein n=1 Tax=Actibacterium ureilyticum TaxID=1590614 RepID=UPI001FE54388|nr:capsule biosynthesis protein [Actibacterium ureilyticum]
MSNAPLQKPQTAPVAAAPRPLAAPSVLPLRPVAPPVPAGRPRRRHGLVLGSLILLVVLPAALMAGYLWRQAADQYASTLGFSVRQEESTAAFELFGGMTALSGSSSSDTDILYEFLQSQELVATLDRRLDLRGLWSRPENDPVFAFDPPGSIEDLVDYWGRMVRVSHDSSTGLIEVRALAFDAGDAQRITQEIFAESSKMINELSDIAREDAIRYARADLDGAEARLRIARQDLTTFRNRNQIVDPTMDTQSRMGLVTTLQEQLAQALIDLDLLRQTTREADPRIKTAELKIQVIQSRIQDERDKLGAGTGADGAFADLVGEYERLTVDREFAEQAYTTALAAFDAARSDAQRQSRYLAAHVRPTLPEQAEYPQRLILWSVAVLFLGLIWSVMVLVGYSLRDRR